MDLTPLTLLVQQKHFSINTFRERKKKTKQTSKTIHEYIHIYIKKKKKTGQTYQYEKTGNKKITLLSS